jgi:hypothetical protein
MERVIDVLHGRADVSRARPRAGYYTADVSRWTLGLILGREWEPYSVAEFNERTRGHAAGRPLLPHRRGTPMDAWLAEAMDHAVAYETHVPRAAARRLHELADARPDAAPGRAGRAGGAGDPRRRRRPHAARAQRGRGRAGRGAGATTPAFRRATSRRTTSTRTTRTSCCTTRRTTRRVAVRPVVVLRLPPGPEAPLPRRAAGDRGVRRAGELGHRALQPAGLASRRPHGSRDGGDQRAAHARDRGGGHGGRRAVRWIDEWFKHTGSTSRRSCRRSGTACGGTA